MDKEEFLKEMIEVGGWDNIKIVDALFYDAIDYYLETGKRIFPKDYYKKTQNIYITNINDRYKLEELPIEIVLKYDWENDYQNLKVIKMISETPKDEIPRDVELWTDFIFYQIKNYGDDSKVLNILLQKEYVDLFFGRAFDIEEYMKISNNLLIEENQNILKFPLKNIDEIAEIIKNGKRLEKLSCKPTELIYNAKIQKALVETGQIDFVIENNEDDFEGKTHQEILHQNVEEIINHLQRGDLNYQNVDIYRLENFYSKEDYNILKEEFNKYYLNIVEKQKEKTKEHAKEIIYNLIEQDGLNLNDIKEIINDYEKDKRKIQTLK